MDAALVPAIASARLPALPRHFRAGEAGSHASVRPGVDPSSRRCAPETLHPALWLGHQLGRSGAETVSSSFALLDAELPGGGWPRRVLSELLLPHPGVGEIRLLAPALVAAQRTGRLVMVFDPPAALSAAALAALGFDLAELLVVHTRARAGTDRWRLAPLAAPRGGVSGPGARRPDDSDSLWALEQALKSGHVGAIVAWLPPRLRAERLRRLQLAALQHDGAAFVVREAAAAVRPTAAPLRLSLQAGGADRLLVRILKRRGPPLDQPLQLALPTVLSGAARRRSASERNAPLHGATFIQFA
jgi:protein ImuA